jgi:MSHA pilin protein MshA
MLRTQKGFTIIELVMVIVILGILAAFAIPRFVNLAGNARTSTVQGLEGSIRSAASMAHSQYLAQSATDSGITSIVVEGQTIGLTNGYPTAADIGKLLQSTDGFNESADGVFQRNGAETPAGCQVSYDPTTNPPTVTSATSDC